MGKSLGATDVKFKCKIVSKIVNVCYSIFKLKKNYFVGITKLTFYTALWPLQSDLGKVYTHPNKCNIKNFTSG